MANQMPKFILFGASMTEWSFDKQTEGLGWFLEEKYRDVLRVVNEGEVILSSPQVHTPYLARGYSTSFG
jgi:hypothetical protein